MIDADRSGNVSSAEALVRMGLNARRHSCRMLRALTPVSAKYTNFRSRLEGIVQQSVRVQFQQPLAFLYIALAFRHILDVLSIHKKNLEAAGLQNLIQRNPPGRRWRIKLPRC